MKIIIPGGSGQVGTILARTLLHEGHEVVILSRNPKNAPWRTVYWDAVSLGDWVQEIDGADVVINLAGKSVNCRYTKKNQRIILDSRVDSTKIVGEAILQAKQPPSVWLQASTATIYAHRYDAPNDEFTGLIGGNNPDAPQKWRFSIDVAKAWEETVNQAKTPHTRKVILRSALTMNVDRGSIFDTMLKIVRFGLGGKIGNGKQFVSWVHETDFIRSVNWLIKNPQAEGIYNIASPNPLPYTEFMQIFRAAWGIPIGLPATKWMAEIGAIFMGTETELIFKSRRVIPARFIQEGFTFQYPDWDEAAQDLCARWRLSK